MTVLEELRGYLAAHCPADSAQTAVPGLVLYRSAAPAAVRVPSLYTPMFCVIAQGTKEVVLQGEVFAYGAGQYLISSVDLPVFTAVREASPERPYLAMSWALNPGLLASAFTELPSAPEPALRGLAVTALPHELLHAVLRLVRLLDRPDEVSYLFPLLEREIAYRLLTGEQGAMLRQAAMEGSPTRGVMRAIAFLRRHYAEPFNMRELLRAAGMSAPSLYRHFKAVTAMSPLQYQKQLRLGEARRMLLSGVGVGDAGFRSGYGSLSQFSREYGRQFGAPPRSHKAAVVRVNGQLPLRRSRPAPPHPPAQA